MTTVDEPMDSMTGLDKPSGSVQQSQCKMTHQMAPPKTHDITLHLLDWTQETLSQVRQVNTSVTDRRCSSYNIGIKLPVSLRFADDSMYFRKQYYL